jgi:hypothetical protein
LEAYPDVEYWYDLPLQIDDAGNDIRRLRQRGHFNHPDDPLNDGHVQGEFPIVQTECNQFAQSLHGLFSSDSSSDYR